MAATPNSRPRDMRIGCSSAATETTCSPGSEYCGRSPRCARCGRPTKLNARRAGKQMGMHRSGKKWRVLSPSTQLIFHLASGARAVIRDTCADGAYRFHWSVIPSEESLPIAAGRTGGLARGRAVAEEALRAYAEDWRGLLRAET